MKRIRSIFAWIRFAANKKKVANTAHSTFRPTHETRSVQKNTVYVVTIVPIPYPSQLAQ